eukprot:CAMPEP_0172545562 /NCGR_PEP_ID=MMETSP1067-20121228/15460_1 /TAXON_ID=265564 ORGANISM="Thalassiosira punctigera, Strain Tpunct2005C2" /NCGR_SAMPLE_ID=MMETSP1067 /ASSEMBLY_ACC=CAM_ASM_000444 /LENGTH=342 /DNA_ID=CAMNT_0013332327 /DNA_START=1 /DNA_END=1029 /DNA_ORIENTATION=-
MAMGGINGEQSNTLLFCTILGFAAISWLLWKFLLSPPAPTGASPSSSTATAGGTSSARTGGAGASSSSTSAARTSSIRGTAAISKKDSEVAPFSFGRSRRPPHLVAPEGWERTKSSDLSGCLVQGVVPFRSTPAAAYEARLKEESAASDDAASAAGEGEKSPPADPIVVNRRERARVFARMFSAGSGGGRPPNRGANIVASIKHAELSCAKLQKALFLLGTYYNLFLLVDGSGASTACGDDKEVKEFVNEMRSELLNQGLDGSDPSGGYKLNAQIVPPHRIAFSSTSKGRVAFVRQLHGTELVVDFDEDVTKELERFGFRVLVYPKDGGGGESSALGNYLIP